MVDSSHWCGKQALQEPRIQLWPMPIVNGDFRRTQYIDHTLGQFLDFYPLFPRQVDAVSWLQELLFVDSDADHALGEWYAYLDQKG